MLKFIKIIEPVKVSIDKIDEFKTSLLNLDTQISSLQIERKNLITWLLNEKQKKIAEILELKHKKEQMEIATNENIYELQRNLKNSTLVLTKEIEADKAAMLVLQQDLKIMTSSIQECKITFMEKEIEFDDLKIINRDLIKTETNRRCFSGN